MTTLRERVGGERRRLKSIRETLTAAVARKSGGDAAFIPFYLAIGEYFETAMGRLHAQDIKMGDMIRAKSGTPLDAKTTKALSELDERLAGNQKHLQALSAAKRALAGGGAAELAHFEDVAAAYCNYIVTNMGHHDATTELAQRLFTIEDWEFMAGVTEAETRTEQEQYARVFAALPAALNYLRPAV